MPVDPATLRGFRPPARDPEPRSAWVAPLVFLGGCVVIGAFALAAWGNAGVTALYLLIVGAATGVMVAAAWVAGWREDGLLGAIDRVRHPLGTVRGMDENRDGMAMARWGLVLAACIAGGVLLAKAPGAAANLKSGRIFGGASGRP